MASIMSIFFIGSFLNSSNPIHAATLLPITTSINLYFHHSIRERVSCARWFNANRQHTNIMYMIGSLVHLENTAVNLKQRYLNERVRDKDQTRKWNMYNIRDIVFNRPHKNFSTDLHHFIAEMRVVDEEMDKFYLPGLKTAEVGEEDQSGVENYADSFKELIMHTFEVRCKLNYWINKKTDWLTKHYNSTTNHLQLGGLADEEEEHEEGYYDLMVDMERNRNAYKSEIMREEMRHLRDYSVLNNLVKQLNWFMHRWYFTHFNDHLHSARESGRVNKRDYGGSKRRRVSSARANLFRIRQNALNTYQNRHFFRNKRVERVADRFEFEYRNVR